MNHFQNLRLILIIAVLFTGCVTPYELPEAIKSAQEQHNNIPTEYNAPDIILDPIEQIPDDPKTGLRSIFAQAGNWGYNYLELDDWEEHIYENATRPVEVFIFDTGGDYAHPDLKPVTRGGKSFTGEDPIDLNYHSTHCAGTYVGTPINRYTPVGIAYELRKKELIHIRPYKVLSNAGTGSFTQITRGVIEANKEAEKLIKDGYFVIYSFSLGSSGFSGSTDAALREAEKLGVLVSVAANGNNGREGVSYPGRSEYTKGIASINADGSRSYFSNYGPETTFGLPGSGILSTYGKSGHKLLSGTSMATPHAGAIAAVLASVYDKADAKQIISHMAKYSSPAGRGGKDDKYGYGIPKIGRMLSNPIADEPNEKPDQPEKPSEPDEPSEPEPIPDLQTYEFTLPKTYTALYRTMSDGQMQSLEFSVNVQYKARKELTDAAISAVTIADRYFANRFLMMPDGSDELDVAYWSMYFFKLIEGRRGNDIEVSRMTLNIGGVQYEYQDKFPKRVCQDETLRANVITFQF